MQEQIGSAIMQWLSGIFTIFVVLPIKTILGFFKFVLIDIPMMAGEKDDNIHK
jgi:hypothetical protein